VNRDTEQTSTNKLQELIFQTYETTPHADPVRLSAIEHGLAPRRQKQQSTKRSRTPWWVIGLALTAGTAAAWWAVHYQNTAGVDQAQENITRSLPPLEHATGDVHENTASASGKKTDSSIAAAENSSDNTKKDKQAVTPDAGSREKSSVIYSREVF